MKILSLHCDYIKFKPVKKAIKEPEKLGKEQEKEKKIEQVLVIFTAVEKQDESNKEIVKQYTDNIKDIAKQVKAENIALYPYAHLSSSLSASNFALSVLEQAETELVKQKFKVTRAPFGYYKEFELKCKGHPLAELSRSIMSQESKEEKGNIKIQRNESYNYKQLLRQISRSKLDTSKLKDNDHRILGQKLDLFSFNEVAPGMVFFHNNGLSIYNE
jgi:threonyl-tRNA synthetase